MASFRDLINKQVNRAFEKTLGDISETASFVPLTSTHSTATAITTNTEGTPIVFKAVFTSDMKRLALLSRLAARGAVDTVEGNADTLYCLCSSNAFGDVVPQRQELIKRGAITYTIETVATDPTNAFYKFGLRLP